MNPKVILNHYDMAMYNPIYREYYAESGFFNFGYWLESTRSQARACENLVERLLQLLPSRKGNILDVACGMGASTHYLQRCYEAQEVVGLNISRKQLESSKLTAPGCRFVLMDAAKMAFNDSSFDNMICIEAAFHFRTRERFLAEAFRVLKRDGCLVLSDVILNRITDLGIGGSYIPVENHVRTLGNYKAICLASGFSAVEIIDVTNECWGGWSRNLIRWTCTKFLERKISLLTSFGIMLGPLLGPAILKHYILIVAKKA